MERGEEFDEDDVWSVLREKETPGPEMKMSKGNNNNLFSGSSSSSSARYIPKSNEVVSVTTTNQSSAPMDIPNWSKIYGNVKENTKSSHLHPWANDDEDEDSMVPPHELVARRLARTQISSFSMCEGIGRTLKGRDLSKTRNDVLTKTGFLESDITPSQPPP